MSAIFTAEEIDQYNLEVLSDWQLDELVDDFCQTQNQGIVALTYSISDHSLPVPPGCSCGSCTSIPPSFPVYSVQC
jgi:hypothetical protein